ncbi:MAG: tol-pal system-associated acyl-CoA thioesterase [Rhodospirillales bacterium]
MTEALPKEPPRESAEGPHVFQLRVYYEDTDAGGVVYYANYLKFAERARTEMLRGLGFENSRLMDGDGPGTGIALAVRQMAVDYLKPARLDDLLEVHTRILEIGGASLCLQQLVRRGTEDLVRMQITLACMNLTSKRTARLPTGLKERFREFFPPHRQG